MYLRAAGAAFISAPQALPFISYPFPFVYLCNQPKCQTCIRVAEHTLPVDSVLFVLILSLFHFLFFTCAPQALPLLARRRRCLTCAPQALPFISYPKHSILFLTCNGRSYEIADPAHHNGVPIGQVEIRKPHRVDAHGRHVGDEAVA